MRYAMVHGNTIVEVLDGSPHGKYTEEVANLFVEIPDKDEDIVGLVYPEVVPPVIEPEIKQPISVLDFRNRFTQAEKIAIYTAAKQVVAIQVWIDDLASAKDVNVTHDQTIAGINALESAGLIGAGRAAEILK
jgi:hypothetical protein